MAGVDIARRCKAPQVLIGLVVTHPSGRCDLAWRPVTIRRGSDHWIDGALDLAREVSAGEALEGVVGRRGGHRRTNLSTARSEEHTSELQSLMRISYAVFCLKKKKTAH